MGRVDEGEGKVEEMMAGRVGDGGDMEGMR